MGFIHSLDSLWVPFSFISIAIALIAWGVACVAQITYMRAKDRDRKRQARRRFYKAVVLFGAVIALNILIVSVIEAQARKEVKTFLTADVIAVQINGATMPESAGFINDIRHINNSLFVYHHTHPTKKLSVVLVTAQGDLHLTFARDSGNANEYWVYDPSYRASSFNDIGKVLTASLADY